MQQIAREFISPKALSYSGTSPHASRSNLHSGAEIPVCGHPNVGTAFVLAAAGEFGEINSSLTVTFEEEAGLVSVAIRAEEGKIVSCELAAPQSLSLRETCTAPSWSGASRPRDLAIRRTRKEDRPNRFADDACSRTDDVLAVEQTAGRDQLGRYKFSSRERLRRR